MGMMFKQKKNVDGTWLRRNLNLKVDEKLENMHLFPLSSFKSPVPEKLDLWALKKSTEVITKLLLPVFEAS